MEGTWTKVIGYITIFVLLDRVAEPPGLCLLIRCAGVFLAGGVTTLLPGFRQLCGAPQGLIEDRVGLKGTDMMTQSLSPLLSDRPCRQTPLRCSFHKGLLHDCPRTLATEKVKVYKKRGRSRESESLQEDGEI